MADKDVKNSMNNSKNGRYVLGGTTEVSMFAIEWWDKSNMPLHPSDIHYVIEKKYEGNPTMLGYVFYGDPGLWWVICQYNNILDPIEEIVEGKVIRVPLLDRIKKDMQTKQLGATTTSRKK